MFVWDSSKRMKELMLLFSGSVSDTNSSHVRCVCIFGWLFQDWKDAISGRERRVFTMPAIIWWWLCSGRPIHVTLILPFPDSMPLVSFVLTNPPTTCMHVCCGLLYITPVFQFASARNTHTQTDGHTKHSHTDIHKQIANQSGKWFFIYLPSRDSS